MRKRLIQIFETAIRSDKFKSFAEQNGFLVDDLTGQALDKEVTNVQATLNDVAKKVFVTAK
ncbi:hypothetical protein D3C72_2552920 [compost metagenome]